MDKSAKIRSCIQDSKATSDFRTSDISTGRYASQHVHLRESVKTALAEKAIDITQFLRNIEDEDAWHKKALVGKFSSELVTVISNNIGDYVNSKLLPYRYNIPILPPLPARSVSETHDYIATFSNTSNLLKYIFAQELKQHVEADATSTNKDLVLHRGEHSYKLQRSRRQNGIPCGTSKLQNRQR